MNDGNEGVGLPKNLGGVILKTGEELRYFGERASVATRGGTVQTICGK